jgi:hypothetical protein
MLAAVCGLSVVGQAQSTSIDTTGLRVRLGGVYVTEKATRRVTGNMIAVGLDYTIRTTARNETYLSADWYGKSGSGAKGNMFPILINQKFFTNEREDSGGRSYLTVGLGVVNIDVTSAKTVLGYRVGAGKEFGKNLFGELAFLGSTEANGSRANSFGAFIGYRF